MAIIIYTYSNPYKINREQYWALVKNSFHLCVSQTLVNGLCDQYREFYKGKLTTIDRFINKLFLDWESDAVEISQRAYIDNVIDYMSFREYVDDDLSEEDIKLSLKRNRSYVLKSLRVMFELGMNPDNIREDCLTYEQKCIVGLFKELMTSGSSLFSLKNDFTKDEVDDAIKQTIADALRDKEKDCSDINIDNVVVHGIHQFTPIMLKTIGICITKISTFLILCDLAVCLATLYVSFSLVFALMRYLQGKVFLIRFYSPTTLSSSRAEFRLPSRLACA